MFFTPKELYDILVEKLQPDDDDYTKIFQLVGDYAYKRDKKARQWIVIASKDRNNSIDYRLPERRAVIKNIDIASYTQGNRLSDDQRILLSLLGITFVEKGLSFLMFSDSNLEVDYQNASMPHEKDRFRIRNAKGIFHIVCGAHISEALCELCMLFNPPTTVDLQRKFYLEREREKVRLCYNALCVELPENTLIKESLPVLVLYQIVQEISRS